MYAVLNGTPKYARPGSAHVGFNNLTVLVNAPSVLKVEGDVREDRETLHVRELPIAERELGAVQVALS